MQVATCAGGCFGVVGILYLMSFEVKREEGSGFTWGRRLPDVTTTGGQTPPAAAEGALELLDRQSFLLFRRRSSAFK